VMSAMDGALWSIINGRLIPERIGGRIFPLA
jgi:hypothetical protein